MGKFLFWDDGCISEEVVESYSNSWKKPALFRERVKKYGVQEVNVVGRSPLYFLSGVHDSAHLHGVLGGSKPTGFGTPSAPAAHAASVACHFFQEFGRIHDAEIVGAKSTHAHHAKVLVAHHHRVGCAPFIARKQAGVEVVHIALER